MAVSAEGCHVVNVIFQIFPERRGTTLDTWYIAVPYCTRHTMVLCASLM